MSFRDWLGLLTGRCLKEARKNMHDSNQFHRDEINEILSQATQTRRRLEEALERIQRAVSVEEMTGVAGDDRSTCGRG